MSAEQDLIEQCEMWCTLTGVKPLHHHREDFPWAHSAVRNFKGAFADLNEKQRRYIAGLKI